MLLAQGRLRVAGVLGVLLGLSLSWAAAQAPTDEAFLTTALLAKPGDVEAGYYLA